MKRAFYALLLVSVLGSSSFMPKEPTKSFTIALHSNKEGLAALEKLVLDELSNIDHPNYGKYLTIDEATAFTAAPLEDRKAVIDWVESFGATATDYKDAIQVTATHSIINAMLHVELFNDDGVIRSDKIYEVPSHLSDIIAFVDSVCNKK